ncbi:hypothetical protein [Clostridium sp. B9]|uniref:hypothetical protein n=1 Tax=Clostridium sp. B9 TaxID=3423224 RepID=UPI003D2F38CC
MYLNDEEYLKKEVKTLCDYLISDDEVFSKKKYAYARVYNSIESIFECQVGGLKNLSLSKEEVKSIIKEFVDNSDINFNNK